MNKNPPALSLKDFENPVDYTNAMVNVLYKLITATGTQIDEAATDLKSQMDAGFAGLNIRMERLEEQMRVVILRLDRIESRLDALEKRATISESAIEEIKSDLKEIKYRITQLEQRSVIFDDRVNLVDKRYTSIADRFGKLENRA